jgi:hypothetical protein
MPTPRVLGPSGLRARAVTVQPGSAIQRTLDSQRTSIDDVRVDHRGSQVVMTEQLLDGADVVARFEQMGCE